MITALPYTSKAHHGIASFIFNETQVGIFESKTINIGTSQRGLPGTCIRRTPNAARLYNHVHIARMRAVNTSILCMIGPQHNHTDYA